MFRLPIFLQLLRLKEFFNIIHCRPCFVFRHPTSLVRNVFLQPLNEQVWYCVIVVGIFVIGITSMISRREEKSTGKIWFDLSILYYYITSIHTYTTAINGISSTFSTLSYLFIFLSSSAAIYSLSWSVSLSDIHSNISHSLTQHILEDRHTHTLNERTNERTPIIHTFTTNFFQVLRSCNRQFCFQHRYQIDQRSMKTVENLSKTMWKLWCKVNCRHANGIKQMSAC